MSGAAVETERAKFMLEPPLRWTDDKDWLIPHLQPLWERHQHRRLVEPFCGGLITALALLPVRALLNDTNPHLINFYRWLKQGLVLSIPMRNDIFVYNNYREQFNRLIAQGKSDSKRAAELFYYLNRTGYEAMCRFNQRGEFNVPFGRYKRISYMTDFTAYCKVLAAWEFTAGDFGEIPSQPDDFVYASPARGVELIQDVSRQLDWQEQERLAEWLARHPGPMVVSNHATDRVIELYVRLGFETRVLEGPPSTSYNGERTTTKEVLALRGV